MGLAILQEFSDSLWLLAAMLGNTDFDYTFEREVFQMKSWYDSTQRLKGKFEAGSFNHICVYHGCNQTGGESDFG